MFAAPLVRSGFRERRVSGIMAGGDRCSEVPQIHRQRSWVTSRVTPTFDWTWLRLYCSLLRQPFSCGRSFSSVTRWSSRPTRDDVATLERPRQSRHSSVRAPRRRCRFGRHPESGTQHEDHPIGRIASVADRSCARSDPVPPPSRRLIVGQQARCWPVNQDEVAHARILGPHATRVR